MSALPVKAGCAEGVLGLGGAGVPLLPKLVDFAASVVTSPEVVITDSMAAVAKAATDSSWSPKDKNG